jgi:predicted nucleotidyltransferase
VPQQDYHEAIESYWWKKIKPILNKIDALAIFGSVARGDATPDSDIDVLIISNKKISLKAAMAEKKIFVPQIYSLKDIQEAIREKSKFMSEIKKDIIQIYDPNGALDEIKG